MPAAGVVGSVSSGIDGMIWASSSSVRVRAFLRGCSMATMPRPTTETTAR